MLALKVQGHHLTPEGKNIIIKILGQMNSKRLSTNLSRENIDRVKLDNDIAKLLSNPPKVVKITIELVDESGEIFKSFDSVKDCSLFLEISLN